VRLAGRPRFDTSGEAVLLARTPDEEERMMDQYLAAPPEDVVSRLAAEPALRMHLLALVASGEVGTEEALESFFAATFYGHTLPMVDLVDGIRSVRADLERYGFLEPGRALRATPFGLLTSELYLDPLSAVVLRRALERAPLGVAVFPLLAAIAATPDLPPLFLRRGEEREMLARYTDEEPELLVKPEEDPFPQDVELFLATIKTAQVLEAWLDETPIVEISERFGIGAGDLRAKVEDAEWLLFGASRIASRFQKRLARPLDDLSLRIRYGAREELLDLVHLRGIGRARGRALYNAGFPDREALRAAPVDRVAAALRSPRLAEAVLREVRHPHVPKVMEPAAAAAGPSATSVRRKEPARGRPKRRSLEEYHTDPDVPATR